MNYLLKSLIAIGVVTFSTVSYAADTTAAQKTQIEGVVRDYLVQNPDVIIQALQVYQKKQMEDAQKNMQKAQETASKLSDMLFHQANDPIAGNAKGTITIVDFFDYQCPHCIDMTPVLDSLIKSNSNLRIVFKEFPIRGPISEFTSKAALAAKEQGKYFEFHTALMQVASKGLTEDGVMKIAVSVGLNIDKLKKDMNSPAVNQQIKATYKLAQELGLMGTPAFFIAKTTIAPNASPKELAFIPGQIDQAQMEGVITKIAQ